MGYQVLSYLVSMSKLPLVFGGAKLNGRSGAVMPSATPQTYVFQGELLACSCDEVSLGIDCGHPYVGAYSRTVYKILMKLGCFLE